MAYTSGSILIPKWYPNIPAGTVNRSWSFNISISFRRKKTSSMAGGVAWVGGHSYEPLSDKDLKAKSVVTDHINKFRPIGVVLSDLIDGWQIQGFQFLSGFDHVEVNKFAKVCNPVVVFAECLDSFSQKALKFRVRCGLQILLYSGTVFQYFHFSFQTKEKPPRTNPGGLFVGD